MISDKITITIKYNSHNAMQQYSDGLEVKEILYRMKDKIFSLDFVQDIEMEIE